MARTNPSRLTRQGAPDRQDTGARATRANRALRDRCRPWTRTRAGACARPRPPVLLCPPRRRTPANLRQPAPMGQHRHRSISNFFTNSHRHTPPISNNSSRSRSRRHSNSSHRWRRRRCSSNNSRHTGRRRQEWRWAMPHTNSTRPMRLMCRRVSTACPIPICPRRPRRPADCLRGEDVPRRAATGQAPMLRAHT